MFYFFARKYKFSDAEIESLRQRLIKEEDFTCWSYWDKKQWTYGYGTKAPGPNKYISEEQALIELDKAIRRTIKEYQWVQWRCPFEINAVRREALCDMIFNMGFPTFKEFKKMLKLIFNNDDNDWADVATEAADSKWYPQVGNRSVKICYELQTGYPYDER